MLIAGPVLALIAALVFWPHIAHGGFYSDDWANAADYRFADSPRIVNAVEAFQSGLGARFLLGPVVVLPHALFGLDRQAHLGLAVVLGTLAAACFYALLRTLGLESAHAGPMATMALLFPWSDSVRLWPTAGINNVAVILYFLAVIVAVRGLATSGRRAIAVHAGAQALYLLAVFTYEAPLFPIFLSGLLYIHRARSPRVVLRRWQADAVLGLVTLLAVLILTDRASPSLHDLAKASVLFPTGALTLAGRSILPLAIPDLLAAAVFLMALILIGRELRSRGRRYVGDPILRRWSVIGLTAAAFIGAAHLVFFGSGLVPLGYGTENRGNSLAGYGYVVLAYATIMVLDRLLSLRRRAWAPNGTSAFAVVAIIAVVSGYALQVRRDMNRWDRADNEQAEVLRAVTKALPAPPRGSTLYVTGAPLQVARGIPVFAQTWDLDAALHLEYLDDSISAYPVDQRTHFVCAAQQIYPLRPISAYGPSDGYGLENGSAYGKAYVIDTRTAEATLIADRGDCVAEGRRTGLAIP